MNKNDAHKPWPIGFAIHARAVVPDPELVAAFKGIPSAIVSDCQSRSVGAIGLLPFHGNAPMCGPALTVRVRPGDNLMIHKALELIQPGDVLVVDGSGDLTQALVGGLMREMMIKRGAAGLVANGAVRDVAEWQQGGLPCFALGSIHRGPTKDGPGEINVPISCAGLAVCPGDLVIGDPDGVVAVPPSELKRLLPLARKKMETEAELLASIRAGTMPSGRYDTELRAKGCPI